MAATTDHQDPPAPLPLADGFEPATRAEWRALVDKVLDKRGELDGAALDARYEDVLVTTTYDDLRIDPLYTATEPSPPPPAGMPGQPPYVRGVQALGRRRHGWDVRQVVRADGTPAEVAAQVLDELERGTTQVVLDLGPVETIGADRLDESLAGTQLELASISVHAPGRQAEAVAALAEVWTRRGTPAAERRSVLGLDPIGEWLRAAGTTDLDDQVRVATGWAHTCAAELPAVVPLVADGALLHDAGGAEVDELGGSIALGTELLRQLGDAGIGADAAARLIEFRYAATPDQFLTIAKLRAARRLWQRVTEIAGCSEPAQRQRQHAVSSAAAAARYDVWVNLLRSTVEAFSAGVGGADAVTIRPHDDLVRPGGSPLGRRLARNAQLVLIEESNLAQVVDPAGGSWYVEHLTDQLAQRGWALFQELEAAGGIVAAARSGVLQDRLAARAERRDAAVRTRRHPLTGLSEFPDVAETPPPPLETDPPPAGPIAPLVLRRHGQAVEAQRARADVWERAGQGRPEVFLVTLGTPAVHTARATFAKNLFEVGGIRALVPGGFDDPISAAQAFQDSGARLACICSSDDRYREQAVAVAEALAGLPTPPVRLYLAGRPPGLDDAVHAAGVDELVSAGDDVLDVVERAHDVLDEVDPLDAGGRA